MPAGVPVATVALNGAKNAGILAAQIVGVFDKKVATNLKKFKEDLRKKVEDSARKMEKQGHKPRPVGFNQR